MYRIQDQGNYEHLPELALAIYEGKAEQVTTLLDNGHDLNAPIQLGTYTSLVPLHLAIVTEQSDMIRLLVERGAELNTIHNPAMLKAVRYASEQDIRYLYESGARLDLYNNVKSGAYQEAYYGGGQHIPLLQELGLDIVKHAGKTLRTAVQKHDMKIVDYLLNQGVDINYNEANQVYPYKATPLTVAVRNGDVKMAHYLLDQGADVTITEKGGERAYTIARTGGHHELAERIKQLEPPEFQDKSNKHHSLLPYKLPADLQQWLEQQPQRLELPENNEYGIRYIDFFQLMDTIAFKFGRTKLLRLSSVVDNYSHLHIVWHAGSRKIACYDEEHLTLEPLTNWKSFQQHPLSSLETLF
ncbi:ankyrin repeat domain-containing protein [Paenibacillus sp. WLX1005]|uniref:ankyrin repeat domain-containing protein n=1 Tax=Paenibacillus sp. WLX1005 TaxID=3243766 RepID=UPI00398450E8